MRRLTCVGVVLGGVDVGEQSASRVKWGEIVWPRVVQRQPRRHDVIGYRDRLVPGARLWQVRSILEHHALPGLAR